MTQLDLLIIAGYFALMIFAGLWSHRRASKNLDDYFLGGRQMPWWLLALSGASANFDISGTCWQVSMLLVFGFMSFNINWMWAFLAGAFLMSYTARWIRRTGVMTGAELMKARFGEDAGGRVARSSAAAMLVMAQIFGIGYAFVGAGKFAAPYCAGLGAHHISLSETQCAMIMTILTTVYVIFGGFTSVVVTDVIQVIIKNAACLIVAVVAFLAVDVSLLHAKISASLLPAWRLDHLPPAYISYQHFGYLLPIWIMNGLFISMGGAGGSVGEQRFLACRNTRDASISGAMWNVSLVLRWAMVASIAFLAVSTLHQSGDPEQALSLIIRDHLPNGIRGFVVAAFLAAYMATFSAVVNSGASLLVNDLIRPFAPSLSSRTLVRYSYAATLLIVIAGIWSGLHASSINKIWSWIMVGLYSSIVIPNALRWYWWRMNGWGYSIGVLSAMALALVVLFFPNLPEYIYAPVINGVAFLGCVVGSLCTAPIEERTIVAFFRQVRPKGFWKPVREQSGVSGEELNEGVDRTQDIVRNVVVASVALYSGYLIPMYLVGHWFAQTAICAAICTASCVILYFTWYRRLEPAAANPTAFNGAAINAIDAESSDLVGETGQG